MNPAGWRILNRTANVRAKSNLTVFFPAFFPSSSNCRNPSAQSSLTPFTFRRVEASEMPGPASDSSPGGALVLSSSEVQEVIYPIRHEVKPPIARLSISWARGNSFRVSIFKQQSSDNSAGSDDGEIGGQVLEVKIRNDDGEINAAEFRRIAYGSVSPFALLQSRKNMVSGLSKMSMGLPQFNPDG